MEAGLQLKIGGQVIHGIRECTSKGEHLINKIIN